MPGGPILQIEDVFDGFSDARAVFLLKLFQGFDGRDDGLLRHRAIREIVSLDPDLAVSGSSVDVEDVAVFRRNDHGLGATFFFEAIGVHLSCFYFAHAFFSVRQRNFFCCCFYY